MGYQVKRIILGSSGSRKLKSTGYFDMYSISQ